MKPYVKPELFYESFELSQHIAVCGIDVNSAVDTCAQILDEEFWPGLGGSRVFDTNCDVDTEVIDVYCYTAGTNEAGKLFNS